MALTKRSGSEEWPAWFGRWMDWPESFRDMLESASLKVEEYEDQGDLVVRAEMPGIDPERDVDISVTDHTLQIRAERRETKTDERKGYRSEFRYGSFSRTVRLPSGASADDIQAKYTDGILEVRVPIDKTTAESKKIPIARS